MASRRAPGGRLSKRSFAVEPPRRRPLAAFALGAAIAAVGLAILAADGAAARGPFLGAYSGHYAARGAAFTLLPLDPAAGAPRRRHRHDRIAWAKKHEKLANISPREAVCVRLCDGYFFPLPPPPQIRRRRRPRATACARTRRRRSITAATPSGSRIQ